MKPSSLQEAVSQIQAAFPVAELQKWAAQSEDDACTQAHWELGMWIRNNWVYSDGSPLATKIKAAAGFIHDDEISSVVLKALWRVLNGGPCPSVEDLLPIGLSWPRAEDLTWD